MAKARKAPALTKVAQKDSDEARADALFRYALGNRIVKARERQGLSQAKLAQTAGLSRTVLNGYEKGNTTPGARQLEKLCTALEISPSELIYGPTAAAKGSPVPHHKDASVEDVASLATLFAALAQHEREVVITVLRGLFVEKHGVEALRNIELLTPGLASMLSGKTMAVVEKSLLDKPLTPEMKAAIAAMGETPPETLGDTPSPGAAKKRR